MADRPMILARCGEDFELTLAALLNLWRITNTTPPPYSTATGRGYNSKQQSLEAITSFVLACILNDPKNTAKLVPAVGNMAMAKVGKATTTTFHSFPGMNALFLRDFTTSSQTIDALISDIIVFDFLCSLAKWVIDAWASPNHLKIRQHFELDIQVSPKVSAELTWEPDVEGRKQTFWFFGSPKRRKAAPKRTIPARKVVMTFDHIEMIADLYRDTLAHEAAAKDPDPQPSLTLDAGDDVPRNDEGDAPRKASPNRNTRTTAKQSQGRNSREIKTESEFSQPCRADGLVTFNCEG